MADPINVKAAIWLYGGPLPSTIASYQFKFNAENNEMRVYFGLLSNIQKREEGGDLSQSIDSSQD